MRRIAGAWHKLKLRYKFLLSFLLIITLTVSMISLIVYIVSFHSVRKLTSEYSQFLIEQIGFNLDKRMNELEEHVFVSYKDSQVTKLLHADREQPEAGNPYTVSVSVLNFMGSLMYSKPYIRFVMIASELEQTEFLRRPGVDDRAEDVQLTVDKQRLQQKRGQVMWVPGGNGTLYMQRAMYDVETSAYIGLIVLGIDSRYFSEIYDGVDRVNGGTFLILNEDVDILSGGSPFVEGMVHELADRSFIRFAAGTDDITYHNQRYLATIQSFSEGKWKLLNIIPVSELTRPAEKMRGWIMIACFISALLSLFIALFISQSITANIKLLLGSMKGVAEGRFDQTIVTSSRDEVGQLANRFNMMTKKINELINGIYKETLLKEQAEHKSLQFEYQALQAQMNPHFLYNTLESIQSMAILKGQPEIGEMVYSLGWLLRETIREKGDFVALRDEMKHVRHYLAIQQIMYEEQMEVSYEVDEAVLDVRVPKLILQPIVENAVMHGIEKKPGKGIVRIRCSRDHDTLLLEVEDNGVGMDEATAAGLLSLHAAAAGEQNGKHTRVGIRSVNKRIQILHGSGYGVNIRSELSTGTLITIALPMNTGDGED